VLPDIGLGLKRWVAIWLFQSRPIVEQIVADPKKILITTESRETFVLRTSTKGRALGHCARCGQEVEMLSIDQAVSASGIKTSDVIMKINREEIHGIETESGHILICAKSLPHRRAQKGDGE
jgi:hypothetical protein